MNGLQLPNWIVPVAGLAAAIWAIAMWWMVATLPSAGASESELNLIVALAEIDALEVQVDELTQEIATLHQQRGELALRLDSLEEGPVTTAALSTTRPIAPVAGAPPPSDSAESPDDSDEGGEASEAPESSEDRSPAAETSPTPAPTAEPTAVVEPTATPVALQFFTDGRDRYNCKDFDSWEQAQAAYEANLPGDPNKIDIDRNGIACEALR